MDLYLKGYRYCTPGRAARTASALWTWPAINTDMGRSATQHWNNLGDAFYVAGNTLAFICLIHPVPADLYTLVVCLLYPVE